MSDRPIRPAAVRTVAILFAVYGLGALVETVVAFAQGRTMIQTADLGELGEFCYFHMPETDSVLELLYLSELPAPEKTIG